MGEQLEVALFEGVFQRIQAAASGRIIHRWYLASGVEEHAADPTFWIPDDSEKAEVHAGIAVKLMFLMRDGWVELMWVGVVRVTERYLVGQLLNTPIGIPRLDEGDFLGFPSEAIVDIDWDGEAVRHDLGEVENNVFVGCECCRMHIEEFVPRYGRRRSSPHQLPPPSRHERATGIDEPR